MTKTRPSFDELNAYVDNELPAERAAEIADFIAGDPLTARSVAALSRLRSTIPRSIELPDLELPRTKSNRKARMRWAYAACIALFLLIGAALTYSMEGQKVSADWLDAAVELHDAWPLPDKKGESASSSSLRQLATGSKVPIGHYVPDLSASKLSVVFVEVNPSGLAAPSILVGYAGTRGCKVTLLAIAETGKDPGEFRFVKNGKNSAYVWRTEAVTYLLMATGMDEKRFELIANSVYRATQEALPFDETTRTALLESRRKSLPCIT